MTISHQISPKIQWKQKKKAAFFVWPCCNWTFICQITWNSAFVFGGCFCDEPTVIDESIFRCISSRFQRTRRRRKKKQKMRFIFIQKKKRKLYLLEKKKTKGKVWFTETKPFQHPKFEQLKQDISTNWWVSLFWFEKVRMWYRGFEKNCFQTCMSNQTSTNLFSDQSRKIWGDYFIRRTIRKKKWNKKNWENSKQIKFATKTKFRRSLGHPQ